jgi:hypothetical protein
VKRDSSAAGPPEWAVVSPDKQWEAFSHKFNITSGRHWSETRFDSATTDGITGYAYGLASLEAPVLRHHGATASEVVWSPDSRRLAVPRIDDRGVRRYPVYSSTESTPALSYLTATPGDSIVRVGISTS